MLAERWNKVERVEENNAIYKEPQAMTQRRQRRPASALAATTRTTLPLHQRQHSFITIPRSPCCTSSPTGAQHEHVGSAPKDPLWRRRPANCRLYLKDTQARKMWSTDIFYRRSSISMEEYLKADEHLAKWLLQDEPDKENCGTRSARILL